MNYNLKKILILAVTSVAILISVSILFSGSYFHSGLSFNGTFKTYSFFKSLFLAGVLFSSIVFVNRTKEKNTKIIRTILWILLLIVVLFSLVFQPYDPVFDNHLVNEQIYDLLINKTNQSPWYNYFSIFPNNIPITNLMLWIDTPLKYFITDFGIMLTWHAIIGQTLLVIAIFNLIKVSDLVFGKQVGNGLLLVLLMSPTYLMQFTQIAYSDTFALPFLIMSSRYFIEIYYRNYTDNIEIKQSLKNTLLKNKNIKNILFSSLLFSIAMFLRPNVIVVLVAISIVLTIILIKQWKLLIILLSAIILFSFTIQKCSTFTLEATKYEKNSDPNDKMPIESWLLTSYYLGGRSGDQINEITNKYHKYEDRKAYIRKMLLKKVKNLGPVGLVKTWSNKINILFGINTDFGMQYFKNFRPQSKNIPYVKIYSYLTPKIIHLSTISMLLSVMSFFVLPNVFSQKKVKTYSRQEQGTLLIFLAIFESLTLFHVLFWEVQEHYVYMMLPFLLATGAILTSKIFSPKNSVLLLDKERNYNA